MAIEKPIQLNLFRRVDFMHIGTGLDVLMPSLDAHIAAADTMVRYAAMSTDEVFKRLDPNVGGDGRAEVRWKLCGFDMKVNLTRLRTFHSNCMCVGCGLVGNTFLIERHQNNATHARNLSLYSVTEKGMVLMTVDHIMPDSMAGRYSVKNFQTMCSECNRKKSNQMSLREIAMVRANPARHVKSWAHLPFIMLLLEIQEKLAYTNDKTIIPKLKHVFANAIKRLDSDNKENYMKQMTANLQSTLDQLNGVVPSLRPKIKLVHATPAVVTPEVTPVSLSLRIRNWFTSHAAALNKFYVVTQRTA